MLVARRFVIKGRVQGVGYRFHAVEAARVEGIHGWVRNRTDGAVEVLVEGDAEAVTRMEWALRRGPRPARVESVDVTDEAVSGLTTGFRIGD